jgi:hypothetical protein
VDHIESLVAQPLARLLRLISVSGCSGPSPFSRSLDLSELRFGLGMLVAMISASTI